MSYNRKPRGPLVFRPLKEFEGRWSWTASVLGCVILFPYIQKQLTSTRRAQVTLQGLAQREELGTY